MSLGEKAWQAARGRIARAAAAAGRDPAGVRLVAVSKTRTAEEVREAWALGQRAFGENYVQEAARKRDVLAGLAGLEWRLIGPLQGNKAALAAGVFDAVESVDRARIAERLSAARPAGRPPLEVMVQVNISAESSKSGVDPVEAVALARVVAALPRLRLSGFMGIAEPTADVAVQRAQFARLAKCLADARAAGLDVHELSMGMTADLESAILEGATEVRLGTALFGERTSREVGHAG
ncbi:Pyridoxal phosphate homeostasis protein [Burkholderiales bacterium]|nr:Pyridoxal phosphate homeostasis protein [Burkholderiales bacterium]